MMARIQHWAATVDGLGLRERLFLLLSVIAVLFLVLDSLVYQPAIRQQQRVNDAVDNLQLQLTVLEQESRELTQNASLDPLQWRERRAAELTNQGTALDTRIQEQLGLVVDPRQIAQMLRDILDQDKELKLLQLTTGVASLDPDMQNKAPHPALPAIDGALPANLSRYRLTLQMEGSYLAALRFLQQLENLPWALFSDQLDITIQQHPRAQISLQLYTLGAYGGGL